MTDAERENLALDMAQQMLTVAPSSFWSADDLKDMARAALAIAERCIREDIMKMCYEETYEGFVGNDGLENRMSETSQGYNNCAWNIYNKILASIPEK